MWELLEKLDVVLGIGTFFFAAYAAIQLRQRHRSWKVIVLREGVVLVEREISPRRAALIAEDPTDLVLFLKGVITRRSLKFSLKS